MPDEAVVAPSQAALIVVDMQNDFCHPKGYFGRHSDRLRDVGLSPSLIQSALPAVRRLLDSARAAGLFIVHTRFVRAADVFNSVSVIHRIVPKTYTAYAGPSEDPPLVPGSWGAATHAELAPLPGEYVMDKRGFSAFYQTDLELVLRRRGIRTVILAGTVTYVCVLHTAFDAHVRDFDVVVVGDATASWAPELQSPSLRIVELILGAVHSVDVVVSALQRVGAIRAK